MSLEVLRHGLRQVQRPNGGRIRGCFKLASDEPLTGSAQPACLGPDDALQCATDGILHRAAQSRYPGCTGADLMTPDRENDLLVHLPLCFDNGLPLVAAQRKRNEKYTWMLSIREALTVVFTAPKSGKRHGDVKSAMYHG